MGGSVIRGSTVHILFSLLLYTHTFLIIVGAALQAIHMCKHVDSDKHTKVSYQCEDRFWLWDNCTVKVYQSSQFKCKVKVKVQLCT